MLNPGSQRNWSSYNALAGLEARSLRLSRRERREFEPSLWNDLCSEHDARHLYAKILKHRARFSDEFMTVIAKWARDEANHADGFRLLYRAVTGDSEAHLEKKLVERPVDFSKIERFFEDELALCLLLAYDELATTLSYHRDLPFYRAIGPEMLADWLNRVKQDEASHFAAVVRLVRSKYGHRLHEAGAILEEILSIDLQSDGYSATFVLDHDGPLFTPAFLKTCVEIILRKL